MTKPLGQKHSPTGLLIPGHSTDLVYFQSKLCSAIRECLHWNHKGTERWSCLFHGSLGKAIISAIQKNAGLTVCDNTLLWNHWPRFSGETWTCSDDSRNGNTAAHGAACASPTPPNSKGTGNLWFQQGIGTKWKKQFLFSVTTKCGVNVKVSLEAVVEVLYPTGFYSVTIKYINKCPTGPFLAGLTEIETRCYLSREWIWTNLFIAALHIL